MQEAIYSDVSMSTFHDNGGSTHDGGLAILRLQLITARSELRIYIKHDGKMKLTRNGEQLAIALIRGIENGALVYEEI